MREPIKQFVKIVADTLPILEQIYGLGSLHVPGQETFGDLRPIFPGKEYVSRHMHEGPVYQALPAESDFWLVSPRYCGY